MQQQGHREQHRAAGLLGEEGAGDGGPGRAPTAPVRAPHGGRRAGKYEHLEGGGLGVLGVETDGHQQVQHPGRAALRVAPAAAGQGGQQNGGEQLGEDRQHPDRGERAGAADREGGLVQPGHQRRLAVHHRLVQVTALREEACLHGEIALVGVPQRPGEGRDAGGAGQGRERGQQPRPVRRPGGHGPCGGERGGKHGQHAIRPRSPSRSGTYGSGRAVGRVTERFRPTGPERRPPGSPRAGPGGCACGRRACRRRCRSPSRSRTGARSRRAG